MRDAYKEREREYLAINCRFLLLDQNARSGCVFFLVFIFIIQSVRIDKTLFLKGDSQEEEEEEKAPSEINDWKVLTGGKTLLRRRGNIYIRDKEKSGQNEKER